MAKTTIRKVNRIEGHVVYHKPRVQERKVQDTVDLRPIDRARAGYKAPRRSFVPLQTTFGPFHLKQHQVDLSRLLVVPGVRGVLCYYTVGSGKSLASIAAAENVMNNYPAAKGAIVVVPAALQANYMKELVAARVNVARYKIVSHQSFVAHMPDTLDKILIVDEVQNLRNIHGKRSVAITLAAKRAFKRVLLTGTPVMNRPVDIVPLINMCIDERLNEQGFVDNCGTDGLKSRTLLAELLKCRVLYYRPPKSEMDAFYPTFETREEIVFLTPEEEDIYKVNARRLHGRFPSLARAAKEDLLDPKLQTFLTGVRMLSNCMFSGDRTLCTKLVAISDRVTEAAARGQKSLVYSFYLRYGIDIIHSILQSRGVRAIKFTGKESQAEKIRAVEDYNADNVQVLLISKAGGEGLDLKNTAYVHITEPAWNYEQINQVIGRAIRYKSHPNGGHVVVCKWYARFRKRPLSLYRLFAKSNLNVIKSSDPFVDNTADIMMREICNLKDKVNRAFLEAVVDVAMSNLGTCVPPADGRHLNNTNTKNNWIPPALNDANYSGGDDDGPRRHNGKNRHEETENNF